MANDYTYRADHVGSLLPPPALVEARAKRARGEIAPGSLQEAENAAVKSALDMQRSVGIAVATDGGFRRGEAADPLDGKRLAATEAAPLRAATRRPIKVAVPAARRAGASEPLAGALARAAIVKNEIEALIAAGVDYVQLDAPGYAGSRNAQEIDELLKLDTAALSGIQRPDNVRIAAYIDPGIAGAHSISGHEALAARLFSGLPVDRFLLPYDGTGTIDFAALHLVPKGKIAVLGLVSATTAALEDVDRLMGQIDVAAKSIDGDNLALSPASGFSTAGKISEADQRRKLDLVVDVATRWWGFAM
jgi:5-methyltetrahydropteroyltriglutamate--homocysteine methyltransferase